MFNKTIHLGIAAVLAASGVASALDSDPKEPVEEVVDEEIANFLPEPVYVQTLTLDDAIEYGLNSDLTLMDIEFQLKMFESTQGGLEADYEDLQETIKDLEDQMDRLRRIQRELGQRTFQERYMIQEQIKELEEMMENLENTIEKMKSDNTVFRYNQEEAIEAIKMSITSQFMAIKLKEEQLDFIEKTLATQEKRVADLKRQYELGVISKVDYDQATREIAKLESQIEQLEEQIVSETAVFALKIGVEYHPDLTLRKPNLNRHLVLVEQTIPTNELIEQSYNMKVAKENLEWARKERDRIHADKDATKYEKEQADIDVELKLLNISKLKVDGEKAIVELYHNVEKQYHALKDAEKEVEYAKEDFKNMKKRYDIGVISRADYELSEMNVTQALFNYEMEKYNYYLLLQQVNLLEAGVLPLQS